MIKVYVNHKYYVTLESKDQLGDLIRDNNLFGCYISIKEI